MFRDAPTSCFWRKWTVGGSRSLKISRNKLSGSPEASKFQEISFRGAPKPQNFKKQAFGGSRSLKISRNKLSGSPEAREIWKANFRGVPKLEKFEKRVLGCPEKGKCDISKRKVLAEGWKRRVLIEYDCLAYYKNTASTVELSGVSYILR